MQHVLDIAGRLLPEIGVDCLFNRPGSPLRVDYLVTNKNTLSELMERSVVVKTDSGGWVRLPSLEDLLSMKLFSLHSGGAKRRSKDLPDIVALVKEHDVKVDTGLKELCLKFADAELFNELKKLIPEQSDA